MFQLFTNNFINRFHLKQLIKVNKNIRSLTKIHFSSNESTKTNENEDKYDIIINGGGIVGFSLFLALKNSSFTANKKICLIERQSNVSIKSLDRSLNQFSNRVSSITTSAKKFFEEIDIWNHFNDYSKPIEEFYVWFRRYENAINFRFNNNLSEEISEDISEDDIICYIIENNRILSSLQKRVNQFEGNVFYEKVVTDIKSITNGVNIQMKCQKTNDIKDLTTRLLIGCDGFQSIVRQKSNLKLFEHDLEESAIVGTVDIDSGEGNPYNKISFQRFVPFDNSVIALLPLNQEFCSFVWSVPKDSVKKLMEMSDNQFIDCMNDSLIVETESSDFTSRFDDFISGLVPKQIFPTTTPRYSMPHIISLVPESRAVFPLKFSTTLPYMVGSPNDSVDNNRIVIMGDAAHRVHPLAGQGLNLGFGDAVVLSKCINKSLSRGENLFGDSFNDYKQLENCLFDFERKRQFKTIPMLSAIHSMQHLFSCIPTQFLSILNSSDFLKHRIIKFANN